MHHLGTQLGGPRKGSVLSKQSYTMSSLFTLVARLAHNFPPKNPPFTKAFQGTVTVESAVKNLLSRIIALEDHFDSRPGDVAEHRRREELIWYAVSRSLRSSADFLIARLGTLKDN